MRFSTHAWRRLAALVALIATPSLVSALDLCGRPDDIAMLGRRIGIHKDDLSNQRYAELDRRLNQILADLKADKISDQEANRWFERLFTDSSVADAPLIEEWIAAFPKSPAAPLAGAYYYDERARASRGYEYAGKTAKAQFAAMNAEYRKELAMLDRAEALGGKSPLSVARRMEARFKSGELGKKQLAEEYRRGIHEFPKSLRIRQQYIHASSPKWGGSMGQLLALTADTQGLSEADKRYVAYLVFRRAGNADELAGDLKSAAGYYRKSVEACPAYDGSLKDLIRVYKRTNDFDDAIRELDPYIERYPVTRWGFEDRGWAYSLKKDWPHALRDHEKAAHLGSGYGYASLGWDYENGHAVKVDLPKAIEFYEIAYALGIPEVAHNLSVLRKRLAAH